MHDCQRKPAFPVRLAERDSGDKFAYLSCGSLSVFIFFNDILWLSHTSPSGVGKCSSLPPLCVCVCMQVYCVPVCVCVFYAHTCNAHMSRHSKYIYTILQELPKLWAGAILLVRLSLIQLYNGKHKACYNILYRYD